VIPFQETLIIGIGKPGKPGFADVFFSEFQIHPWGIYFGGPAKQNPGQSQVCFSDWSIILGIVQ
jgi:hypothetical protein